MMIQQSDSVDEITKIELRQTSSKRSQHPKQHGCLWAQFIVSDAIPEDLRLGLFRHPNIYPCWIRFSNARVQDDSQGGAHGMAIKLMDVPGPKVLEGEQSAQTQDFVLFDSPVFFIKNLQDYLEFERVLDQAPGKPPWRFLFPSYNPFSWRLKEFYILVIKLTLLKRLFKLSSPLAAKYWSGTPYSLGDNHKVKYFVVPASDNRPKSKDRRSPNYLGESMAEFLKTQAAEFDFFAQLHINSTLTPVDDPRSRWLSFKTVKLATIKIPAQIFNTPKQRLFGENLAYTPWHTLPEHQPLGEINLTRRQVYQETARQRHRWNGIAQTEPQPQDHQPTWSSQNALTVILPILAERKQELESLLAEHHHGEFFQKSTSTHLARFVILHDPYQGIHQPHLLFTSNYDGAFEAYCHELSTVVAPELDRIFSCCTDYLSGTAYTFLALLQFIQDHDYDSQAFFVAAQGSTARSILANHKTCNQLDCLLDQPQAKTILDTLEIPPLDAVKPTAPLRPSLFEQLKTLVIGLLLNLTEYIVGIRKGINDPSRRVQINDDQKQRAIALQAAEDSPDRYQNQMTILVPIRSNFHKRILNIILWLTKRRAQQSDGSLSGISTIHFARWVILEPGTISRSEQSYLLFESNYNGSWDTYINDFVIYAGQRMNLIWGNCLEYPKGGSQDIEWFKQHIRKFQFPAGIFYSAYPTLTIGQVLINRSVCQSLSKFRQDQALESFFSGSYHKARLP